jgi:hypothetical protein
VKYDSPQEAAAAAFVAKADRRRALVALPFEEKIRILRRLQRMASEVRRAAGRPGPQPWPEDTADVCCERRVIPAGRHRRPAQQGDPGDVSGRPR